MVVLKLISMILALFSHTTDITPGCVCTTFDADFDGFRYPEQVAHCHRNVTRKTIDFVANVYHIKHEDYKKYEFDHLVPLAVGGSNNACNIWPQPLLEARIKDVTEFKIYTLLKKGKITQHDAIAAMLPW